MGLGNDKSKNNESVGKARDLAEEMSRTRLTSETLGRYLDKYHDIRVPVSLIPRMVAGDSTAISDALFEDILRILETLPDAPKTAAPPSLTQLVDIDETMRAHLNAELARTGVALKSLVLMCPDDIPSLTSTKISYWRTGRRKSANRVEWQYVIGALSKLPDRKA